ncbi:MAG: TadE/TadG family type IV pilus assembly protein [Sphaerobacter sp.]|nr:TadE/TadG family type IV pilus assembly protein [Sphaerobacter sp.]
MGGPRPRRHGRQHARGQSLVELALVLPILCVMLLGAADVARAVSVYITLGNVAREGAHYASLSPANAADIAGIRAAALQEAGGSIFGVTPAITRDVGTETYRDAAGKPVQYEYVRVEARYSFQPLFAFPPLRPFTMRRVVQMRVLPGY